MSQVHFKFTVDFGQVKPISIRKTKRCFTVPFPWILSVFIKKNICSFLSRFISVFILFIKFFFRLQWMSKVNLGLMRCRFYCGFSIRKNSVVSFHQHFRYIHTQICVIEHKNGKLQWNVMQCERMSQTSTMINEKIWDIFFRNRIYSSWMYTPLEATYKCITRS